MKIFTRAARFVLFVFVSLCFGLPISARVSVGAGKAVGGDDQKPRRVAIPAGVEELSTDDGTPEVATGGDNVTCVNRLTPTSYPATLQTIRIFFVSLEPTEQSPVGAQVKLIVFTGAQGTTQPPSNPTFLVNQTVTIPTLPPGGAFIDFPIQNGPTINGGDFYVGFQAPNPRKGVLFTGDVTGTQKQRAFLSSNNGQSFQGPITLQGGAPVNLMMRAVVSNSAASAARIDAPTAVGFDNVSLGSTGERTLTIRNAGDAPLNVTGLTFSNPQFSAAPGALPLAIAPGAQSAITLRFSPTSAGAQNASVAIASNDAAKPSATVLLSGVGGPAATALTAFVSSGGAQTGSIPAPPPSAGIIYLTQYAVYVPAGASLLKVDLNGNQDLDVFVRFNTPVAVSNGNLQADFGSSTRGVSPESVSITPLSTPQLQSGLYYIAIANFGPGAADFTLNATVTGGTAAAAAAAVSAANFGGPELAGEEIVAGFGADLATTTQTATTTPLPTNLAGTSVKIRDNAGVERLAPLFFVSPTQANFQVPQGTANGAAFLTFTSGSGKTSTGVAQVVTVAPGVFTANSDGQGVPAALVLRVAGVSQTYEAVARFDAGQNKYVPASIDLGPNTDVVFLLLYGTGIRGRSSMSAVTATIGGVPAAVGFAGAAPGFIGLDQINLTIPRSLAGRGDVDVVIAVDGKIANTVKINIK